MSADVATARVKCLACYEVFDTIEELHRHRVRDGCPDHGEGWVSEGTSTKSPAGGSKDSPTARESKNRSPSVAALGNRQA